MACNVNTIANAQGTVLCVANYQSDPLIESSLVLEMTGQDEFYRYHHLNNDDHCLDIETSERKRLTDAAARQIMAEEYLCRNASEFQSAGKETQEAIIRTLLEFGGSLRQISRLTGATIGIIRKHY